MKIAAVDLQQYTLPLARPLTTGAPQTVRQGIILTLHSDTGLQGLGEIAPLPGLHHETLTEATAQIAHYRPDLTTQSIDAKMLSFEGHLSQSLASDLLPSVRSGIEMAMIDLLLQAYPVQNPPESVPINALVATTGKHAADQIEARLSEGFTSIKVKVARQSLEKDIQDIHDILSITRGKLLLRLDANRRWTLQQAKDFCGAIDLRGIEYIEEPTQSPADHAELVRCTRAPIALDETLTESPCVQLDRTRCRAVVLKPSLLGGFEKTTQIIRRAQQHSIIPVISSAFQCALTTRMYVLFAALNGITETPLGLDTGRWFQEDLLSVPPAVERGSILVRPLMDRPKLKQDLLRKLDIKC